jgi:hypothetical protein
MTVPQSCRVCDSERGREGLVESAATCRASSSVGAVRILKSTPDGDKGATQGGGVTSAILAVIWAISSGGTCACVVVMA